MTATVLVAAGAGIFLMLGVAHVVFTLQSKPTGGPLMPTNGATRAAMSVPGGIGLDPEANQSLYQAWIGFNLSHSLGVLVVAALILQRAIVDLTAAVGEAWFLVLVLVVPAIYLALAVQYWPGKPRDGIAIGAGLVWLGLLIELL